MARPPRAEAASTRIVGFRLTDEEDQRLDDLVREQGFRDRSALLRAWIEQGGPIGRNPPKKAEARVSLNKTEEDVPALVLAALRRAAGPRVGLVNLPKVIRGLAVRLEVAAIHKALLSLAKSGKVELRPEAGTEFLRSEDAAICPSGPRGTVLVWARLPE